MAAFFVCFLFFVVPANAGTHRRGFSFEKG
jgi:hypothetical protein